MARIRTIKPEFPQSESMGRVSRDARLLFVMLWPICDDHGRTRASSILLASLLFPYDSDAPKLIGKWLDELEREGCIKRYIFNGSTYLFVCNWLNHQKIDKPSRPQFPEPSGDFENVREDSRVFVVGREGKGKERKGGERIGDSTFVEWMKTIPDDQDAIPSEHSVFAYAQKVGLPADFVSLSWGYFEKYYSSGNGKAKKYKDWPAHFRTAVEDGYGKLWAIAQDGSYYLTTAGKQLQLETRGNA